jgi:carboxypeptidase C (cathepsin A)
MKYLLKTTLLILGACFIISASASIINTTEFYNKQTGQQLYFQSFSGYEDVNSDGSASIYYSLWQGHLLSWDDKSVPLIIWLQGGPGAPSQFGCFNEVGPITIEGKKGNLKAT